MYLFERSENNSFLIHMIYFLILHNGYIHYKAACIVRQEAYHRIEYTIMQVFFTEYRESNMSIGKPPVVKGKPRFVMMSLRVFGLMWALPESGMVNSTPLNHISKEKIHEQATILDCLRFEHDGS